MSKTQQVLLPDIGDFDSVEVIEVLVEAGDVIEKETALITLESDKATMDVPAPFGGTVSEVNVALGDQIAQGDLIVVMHTDSASPAAARADESAETTAVATDSVAPAGDDVPTQVVPSIVEQPQTVHRPPPSLPQLSSDASTIVPASPVVRRLARELGVDLSQVDGSGRKGRILKEDVSSFVKTALSGAEPPSVEVATHSSLAKTGHTPAVDYARWGAIDRQPLSKIQKVSGTHLHQAWLQVPHVTQHDEADVTDLESFRESLKGEAEKAGVRLTPLAFILKATAAALEHFPRLNSSLDADGEHLVIKQYCHIGVAVETDQGLVVPVIRDVNSKGVLQLAAELGEISQRARDGRLSIDDLQGGCFTISSLGGIGGTAFTPIVNTPEVGILGVSRKRVIPQWDGASFQPRQVLPLSLSYDHRVIDGAEGVRFIVHLKSLLEDIGRVLL